MPTDFISPLLVPEPDGTDLLQECFACARTKLSVFALKYKMTAARSARRVHTAPLHHAFSWRVDPGASCHSFSRYAVSAGRSSAVNGRSTFTPSVEITGGRDAGGGGAVAAMNLKSSS